MFATFEASAAPCVTAAPVATGKADEWTAGHFAQVPRSDKPI